MRGNLHARAFTSVERDIISAALPLGGLALNPFNAGCMSSISPVLRR